MPSKWKFPIIFGLALLAQACSDKTADGTAKESEKVTQTRMDQIDSLEGTISDEMIVTDDSNDQAELESASDANGDKQATAAETSPAKPAANADAAAE